MMLPVVYGISKANKLFQLSGIKVGAHWYIHDISISIAAVTDLITCDNGSVIEPKLPLGCFSFGSLPVKHFSRTVFCRKEEGTQDGHKLTVPIIPRAINLVRLYTPLFC